MKPALLVNPRAGGNRRAERRAALRAAFGSAGPVAESGGPEELGPILEQWRTDGVDVIAVSGGDGTMHATIRALAAVWGADALPRLLLLQAGTLGLVARSTGTTAPEVALRRLVAHLDAGTALPEGSLGTLSLSGRLAFNAGLGLVHTLAQWFLEAQSSGVSAAYETTLRAAASALTGGRVLEECFRPWPGEAYLDGARVDPSRLYGIYASVVPDMWIFRSFAAIPVTDAQFRLARLQLGPLALLSRIPLVVAGVPDPIGPGNAVGAQELVLTHPEGVAFMADGEFYREPERLEIRAGPVLRVVQP